MQNRRKSKKLSKKKTFDDNVHVDNNIFLMDSMLHNFGKIQRFIRIPVIWLLISCFGIFLWIDINLLKWRAYSYKLVLTTARLIPYLNQASSLTFNTTSMKFSLESGTFKCPRFRLSIKAQQPMLCGGFELVSSRWGSLSVCTALGWVGM